MLFNVSNSKPMKELLASSFGPNKVTHRYVGQRLGHGNVIIRTYTLLPKGKYTPKECRGLREQKRRCLQMMGKAGAGLGIANGVDPNYVNYHLSKKLNK